MSFLKKILGAKQTAGSGDTVDTPQSAEAKRAANFKNRAERVDLKAWHEVICESLDPNVAFSSPSLIVNMSLSGVALTRSMVTSSPDAGTEFKARLVIKGKFFEVTFKVAHVSPLVIGATYVSPSLEFMAYMKAFFMVEVAALKLSTVAPQFVKPASQGIAHWLEGEKKTSVYYVETDGKIVEFNLSFFGNTIEYHGDTNWRFGQTQLDSAGNAFNSSTGFKWDTAWPPQTVELARRFIDAIPKLRDSEKLFFESIINRIPVL